MTAKQLKIIECAKTSIHKKRKRVNNPIKNNYQRGLSISIRPSHKVFHPPYSAIDAKNRPHDDGACP